MPRRRNPGVGPLDWLRRARSNLARARDDSGVPEVLYEDLCFDCQQAAEKAVEWAALQVEGPKKKTWRKKGNATCTAPSQCPP